MKHRLVRFGRDGYILDNIGKTVIVLDWDKWSDTLHLHLKILNHEVSAQWINGTLIFAPYIA